MQNFRKLKVWEKAHELVLMVYRETAGFPDHEQFGLTSQVRRASSSIPTNIAEGSGRNSNPDFARFLTIAMGSATEVEYQVMLATDLNYLNQPQATELDDRIQEIKRMLVGLHKKLKATTN